jgi:hypothetical protein
MVREWLRRPRIVTDLESENLFRGVPFGFVNDEWEKVKGQMVSGDEIWEFSSSDDYWKRLPDRKSISDEVATRAGVSLVRNGEIVASLVVVRAIPKHRLPGDA